MALTYVFYLPIISTAVLKNYPITDDKNNFMYSV